MALERLKDSLVHWAEHQDDIVGIGVVGSYARGEQRRGSDIDLIVVAKQPAVWISNTAWLGHFGEPVEFSTENYGLVQSIRCFYKGGAEVEFGITSLQWCSPPIDAATAHVIRSGMQVIYDPSGCLRRAQDWVSGRRDQD